MSTSVDIRTSRVQPKLTAIVANRKQRRRKAKGSGASRTTAGASGARTPAPAAPVPDLPDEHLVDDESYAVLVQPHSLTELAWLIEQPGAVLDQLALLSEMRTLLREAERTLVGLGRQQGYSWGRLATPLHRSRQALHKMHGPHVGGWGGAPVEPVSR